MSIYWRDLFKPRFAVVVVAVRQGLFDSLSITRGAGAVELNNSDEARGVVYTGAITVPCIMDRPFQRPLSMPFQEFHQSLSKRGLVLTGHWWALRRIQGTGCSNDHLLNKPVLHQPLRKDS